MEIPDRPTFRSKMPLWLTRGSMLLTAAVTLMAALLFSGSASASTSGTDLKWVEDAARGCLRGTTVIVTGATRGIGREVAHKLASVAGAHTILACRNVTACQNTAQHIRKLSPGASVECAELDLARLSSVEEFAKTLAGRKGSPQPINLLVHNAGVMAVDDERTEDGFETTFQVNHLAPFLLTLRLLPCLRAASTATRSRPPPIATLSAAATFQSGGLEVGGDEGKGGQSSALDGWGRGVRVVWVSSGAHKWGSVPGRPGVGVRGSQEQEGDGGRVTGLFGIAFNQRRGMLGRWRAYADSKLLNAMIAAEGVRRFEAFAYKKKDGVAVTSVAVRPGTVATDITRNSPGIAALIGVMKGLGLARPLPRSAQGILYACTVPLPHKLPSVSSSSASAASASASTSGTSQALHGRSSETSKEGKCELQYDVYFDDTHPVPPHPNVLNEEATSLAWRDSEQLLREWHLRVGGASQDIGSFISKQARGEGGERESQGEVLWGFDLPQSLEALQGATFAPTSRPSILEKIETLRED